MTVPAVTKRLAARAADRLLAHNWRLWFWGDSIGLEGLLDAADLTGDGHYLGYVHGLLKGWIARERHRSEFDYTAPGVALLRTYELTGDGALFEAAGRHAEYLAGFRRTDAGAYLRYENAAFERPPELPPGYAARGNGTAPEVEDGGPCLFVDCVHFDAPFFAKLYQITEEERYRELALANIISQVELLWDAGAGLFHHFWIERSRSRNGVLWGRGNGWGLLGIVLTLEHIGPWHPAAAPLRAVLSTAAARLAELQDASGAWRTVLTDPESYVEGSTAAFFADVLARGIRLGLLGERDYCKVLDRAMAYVLTHIDSGGALEEVSFETFPSTRLEHYRAMPRGAVVPWGQGPLLGCLRSYAALEDWRRLSEPPREAHATEP